MKVLNIEFVGKFASKEMRVISNFIKKKFSSSDVSNIDEVLNEYSENKNFSFVVNPTLNKIFVYKD